MAQLNYIQELKQQAGGRNLSIDWYRKKIRENDNSGHSVQAHANEQYLVKFYTCCTMIPIFLILGTLFYSFWYLSPKS